MPLEEVKRNIIGGKVKRISSSVQLALTRGYSAEEIINAMTESMLQVGALFHNNDIFVPEMLVAAATMKKGLALLRPLLSADRQTNHEKFILGTVQGDLHDVGKNLVCCTLESFGFEVIDLGVDVPPEVFVETERERLSFAGSVRPADHHHPRHQRDHSGHYGGRAAGAGVHYGGRRAADGGDRRRAGRGQL